MKFEDLTLAMQEKYCVLTRSASQTIKAEIEDALDNADDQEEFVMIVDANMEAIKSEASNMVDEFNLCHSRSRCRVRKDLIDKGNIPCVMNCRFERIQLDSHFTHREFSIMRDNDEEPFGVKAVTAEGIIFYFNSADIERLS